MFLRHAGLGEVGAGDQQHPPVGHGELGVHLRALLGSLRGRPVPQPDARRTPANAAAGSAPASALPGPAEGLHHHAHRRRPAPTAAASASSSGGYGSAEYVMSSSSRAASPTSSTSTCAVARTGTAWVARPAPHRLDPHRRRPLGVPGGEPAQVRRRLRVGHPAGPLGGAARAAAASANPGTGTACRSACVRPAGGDPVGERPAGARRRAGATAASAAASNSGASSWQVGKERQVGVVDRDHEPPVEEPVAPLAGGLGDEQADVAGGAVQEVRRVLRQPLGAQRVGGAVLRRRRAPGG